LTQAVLSRLAVRVRPNGQAIVEFALVITVFLLTLLPVVQMGVIALQQYSLMRVTRETTRWLAVNWGDTVDANALHHARGENFVNPQGTPVANASGNPLTLRPSLIQLSIDPSCPSLDSSIPPKCAGRAPSGAITVTATYDIQASGVIFFPAGANIGSFHVGIPTGPRTYSASMVME